MNKLNISKELFVKHLNNIKDGWEQIQQFNKAMEEFSDNWYISNLGHKWFETSLALISLAVDDKDTDENGTILEWWIFDTSEKVITCNGKKISVETPEQLYDYFLKYN